MTENKNDLGKLVSVTKGRFIYVGKADISPKQVILKEAVTIPAGVVAREWRKREKTSQYPQGYQEIIKDLYSTIKTKEKEIIISRRRVVHMF